MVLDVDKMVLINHRFLYVDLYTLLPHNLPSFSSNFPITMLKCVKSTWRTFHLKVIVELMDFRGHHICRLLELPGRLPVSVTSTYTEPQTTGELYQSLHQESYYVLVSKFCQPVSLCPATETYCPEV